MLDRRKFVWGVMATAAWAQNGDDDVPLFKTGVSVVRVDAKVTSDGREVSGLEAGDFAVYDEGERQRIAGFARESDPVEVVLVLDVSPSMRKELSALAEKSGDALDQLRPGDRAGVLAFAEKTRWIEEPTTEIQPLPKKIIETIFRDDLGRTTYLNRALAEAATHMGGGKGRRAVVVVTDNELARDNVSNNEVIRKLHDVDAVLNVILLGSSRGRTMERYHAPVEEPDVFLFAKATGGDVVTTGSPAQALENLLRQAHTRYTLEYSAPAAQAGTFRRIRVELTEDARHRYPDAVVQARTGYTVN